MAGTCIISIILFQSGEYHQCQELHQKGVPSYQFGLYGEGAPKTIFHDSLCAPEALLRGFLPNITFFSFIVLKVIKINKMVPNILI